MGGFGDAVYAEDWDPSSTFELNRQTINGMVDEDNEVARRRAEMRLTGRYTPAKKVVETSETTLPDAFGRVASTIRALATKLFYPGLTP